MQSDLDLEQILVQ